MTNLVDAPEKLKMLKRSLFQSRFKKKVINLTYESDRHIFQISDGEIKQKLPYQNDYRDILHYRNEKRMKLWKEQYYKYLTRMAEQDDVKFIKEKNNVE